MEVQFQPPQQRQPQAPFPDTVRYHAGRYWRREFGNCYVSNDCPPLRHVCDFTCNQRVFRMDLGFFECAISGLPARCFLERCKRASEDDLRALVHDLDHEMDETMGGPAMPSVMPHVPKKTRTPQ